MGNNAFAASRPLRATNCAARSASSPHALPRSASRPRPRPHPRPRPPRLTACSCSQCGARASGTNTRHASVCLSRSGRTKAHEQRHVRAAQADALYRVGAGDDQLSRMREYGEGKRTLRMRRTYNEAAVPCTPSRRLFRAVSASMAGLRCSHTFATSAPQSSASAPMSNASAWRSASTAYALHVVKY